MRHINWAGPQEWKEFVKTYGEKAAPFLNGRNEDWDRVVLAIKEARQAGVPWELLTLPAAVYESSSSRYGYSDTIESINWAPRSAGYSSTPPPTYLWPLGEAFYRSAKAARALIGMGAPLQTVLRETSQARADQALPDLDPEALKEKLLHVATQGGTFHIGGKRVVGGMSVIALVLKALGTQLPQEKKHAFALQILNWARKEKDGLWLNKPGCLPAEVHAAKKAFWAQEIAQSILPLSELDAVWGQDANKVAAKAKASGSSKAAQAARDAEQLPQTQLRRWPMIGRSLIHDDLEAWVAMESLAGLTNAEGLNLPMSSHRSSMEAPGSLWLTHAVSQGALQIASRMLLNGANPWLVGPEVFKAQHPDIKSPVMALASCGKGNVNAEKWAALGSALGTAMMRDAQAVEPSEEAARALVRQEFDERLNRPEVPEALRSAIERWSLSISLGIKTRDAAASGEPSSVAPRKARNRL